jgi:hypothetical protein
MMSDDPSKRGPQDAELRGTRTPQQKGTFPEKSSSEGIRLGVLA